MYNYINKIRKISVPDVSENVFRCKTTRKIDNRTTSPSHSSTHEQLNNGPVPIVRSFSVVPKQSVGLMTAEAARE